MKTKNNITNADRNKYGNLIKGLKSKSDQEKVIRIVRSLERAAYIDINDWNCEACVWCYSYEGDDEDGYPSEVVIDVGSCSNMNHCDPDQVVFTPEDLAKAKINRNTVVAKYTYHGRSDATTGTATIKLYDHVPHIIR